MKKNSLIFKVVVYIMIIAMLATTLLVGASFIF